MFHFLFFLSRKGLLQQVIKKNITRKAGILNYFI